MEATIPIQFVSSALPFANIYWFQQFINQSKVVIDLGEFFEKMSFRNRYEIGTANGVQTLSIPLVKGRNQRTAMQDVQISYAENWQKNHWKSLEAAYMRTPFFEYYKDYLQPLYSKEITSLSEWNLQSLDICLKLLKLPKSYDITNTYISTAENDIRNLKPNQGDVNNKYQYIQPFEHKWGFLPNLSILDLLFCEGPNSLRILKTS